jgi:hypothetical protein
VRPNSTLCLFPFQTSYVPELVPSLTFFLSKVNGVPFTTAKLISVGQLPPGPQDSALLGLTSYTNAPGRFDQVGMPEAQSHAAYPNPAPYTSPPPLQQPIYHTPNQNYGNNTVANGYGAHHAGHHFNGLQPPPPPPMPTSYGGYQQVQQPQNGYW